LLSISQFQKFAFINSFKKGLIAFNGLFLKQNSQLKKIKKITDLQFDDENINKGSEFGSSLLAKSLQEVGAGRSVLADKNGVLIAGNKTIEQASQLGMTKIKVVETKGDELVVVQRTDLDIKYKLGAKMKILDNTVSRHNYVEDADVALAVCEEFSIDGADLGLMPLDVQEAEEDGFVTTPPLKPITKSGDIYELNQHRFTCGDSCDRPTVEKTLAWCSPVLLITDPPYGVNYDPAWRQKMGISKSNRVGKVQNDDRCSWREAYSLFSGEVAYVWHASRNAKTVAEDLEVCGFKIVCQIIWNKQQIVLSRGDYHWKHEPCWYAVKKGSNHNWNGDRKQATVWDIQSILQSSKKVAEDAALVHGTQKPIECIARPIRNNTYERQSISDPFLGSGTTLIAGDILKRACYGLEIDPAYCDLIVARFIKFKRSQGGQDSSFEIKKNGKAIPGEEIEKFLHQIQ
jgi:DNA modification methylase